MKDNPTFLASNDLSASLRGKLDHLADVLCKQFGSRSGPTERQARSGSTLFDSDGQRNCGKIDKMATKTCKITWHADS